MGGGAARPPPVRVAILIEEPGLADHIFTLLADQAEIRIDDPNADVVIMDALPDAGGNRPIILISDQVDVIAALHGGAAGVLPTTVTVEQLRIAVGAVAQGLSVIPAEAVADTLDALASEDDPRAAPAPATPLTPRELEVLNLMAAGASNKVIARNLGISIHTAKFHVASILAKLDATGRTDAVAQAARLGLLML
jgi:DNA-binding NarL/FixJ family response regulator